MQLKKAEIKKVYSSKPHRIGMTLLIPLFIVGVLATRSSDILHWFIIPVIICGILAFDELLRCNIKRTSVFAPWALVSIAAVPFFFLNPILHVYWNSWMKYVVPPPDWRPWLGGMAILNAMGIVIYKVSRRYFNNKFITKQKLVLWQVDERRLRKNLLIAMSVSAILQIGVFARFGGIAGYINEFESRSGAFSGLGTLFVFSESFPILLAIYLILLLKKSRFGVNDIKIYGILLLFLLFQLLFSGLRGSRGNTIYSVFWIVGIMHFYLKPFSTRKIVALSVVAFIFIYIYGFYKVMGSKWVDVFKNGGIYAGLRVLEEESGKTIKDTILGDFGRSDVQSYLLYRAYEYPGEYTYAHGKTYIEDLAQLVPQWIWKDRPIGKTLWGTDILRGIGAWSSKPGGFAQNAYGLGGEAILNFSPVSVPIFYLILGFAVARISVMGMGVRYSLLNTIFYPLFIELCAWMLFWDLGNIAYFIIHFGLFPMIVLTFSLKGRRVLVLAEKKWQS